VSAESNVFLGTSDFAATILRTLAGTPHRPTLVVTPPDRRSGRGRKVGPPPVAVVAGDLGLDLLQTADVNDQKSRHVVNAASPGVAIVCAFGQLIREPLLSLVPMLNVHPSLLPRWRGAAPVERALMAGDERTGVCVIQLAAGLDSGPVALCKEIAIEPADDYGILASRLADLGGRALIAALDLRSEGRLELTEQAGEGVTYAEKIEPAERRVDPSNAATNEALRVRALTPHIGAYVGLDAETRLGVRDAVAQPAGLQPGDFAATEAGDGLLLGCRDGALRIATVQPQGKRWIGAADYLRGYGLPQSVTGPDGSDI
jgi:methionyl-tRNA formyltransferase